MPIKKGNTTISAIYKGTTQIAKVYKGTKLLFENAVWLDYYFSNLYHSLVPETLPKNLFDGEIEGGSISSSTGENVSPSSAPYNFRAKNYIKVAANETYNFSVSSSLSIAGFYLQEYDSSKNFITQQTKYASSGTLTVGNTTAYVRFQCYKSGSNWGTNPPTQQEANIQFYNKIVSVKNKAKVSVIEANGVIENQLVDDNTEPHTIYGYTGTITDGVVTITKNAMGDYGNIIQLTSWTVSGHKYFFYCNAPSYAKIKLSSSSLYCASNSFATASGTDSNLRIRVDSEDVSWAAGTSVTFRAMAFDLTLMFGTGNEPTAITDNRIQALLNRGYIPYNAGTYKGTDIGLFSSDPYNLFDGELEIGGTYNVGTIDYSYKKGLVSADYVSVLSSKTYLFEVKSNYTDFNRYCVCEYDENKVFVQRTFKYKGVSNEFTLSSSTRYVRLAIYDASADLSSVPDTDFCFHLQGTRTGYAPYQSFTPIAFKYQGNGAINAHDTMIVTKDNVVFGKNVGSVDLGTLSYGIASAGKFYINANSNITNIKIPSSQDDVANVCAANYLTINGYEASNHSTNMALGINPNGYFYIRDDSCSTVAALQAKLSGVPLYYELATPQTITIPRKHLGVLRLSDYITSVSTANSSGVIQIGVTNAGVKANTSYINVPDYIYCSKYLNDTYSNVYGGTKKSTIGFVNNTIGIQDDNLIGLTYTQVKEYFIANDVLVFYETENEVADILDTVDIEAGGTVNANWFSWVENQLITNGNFESASGWASCNTSYGTLSVANNIAKITMTTATSDDYTFGLRSAGTYQFTNGHKVLMSIKVKSSKTDKLCFDSNNVMSIIAKTDIVANQWVHYNGIATATGNSQNLWFYVLNTNVFAVNDTLEFKDFMFIDLTQAFGSGNEPTSVSDPRIQYILNKGYIPTNTTGTYKLVDVEVLPNVEFKVKCK